MHVQYIIWYWLFNMIPSGTIPISDIRTMLRGTLGFIILFSGNLRTNFRELNCMYMFDAEDAHH